MQRDFHICFYSDNHQAVPHYIHEVVKKEKNKVGKFLKKLWCCVGGSITR